MLTAQQIKSPARRRIEITAESRHNSLCAFTWGRHVKFASSLARLFNIKILGYLVYSPTASIHRVLWQSMSTEAEEFVYGGVREAGHMALSLPLSRDSQSDLAAFNKPPEDVYLDALVPEAAEKVEAVRRDNDV